MRAKSSSEIVRLSYGRVMHGLRYLSVLIGTLAIAAGITQLGIALVWGMGTFLMVLVIAFVVWLPAGALIVGGLPERWKRARSEAATAPAEDEPADS